MLLGKQAMCLRTVYLIVNFALYSALLQLAQAQFAIMPSRNVLSMLLWDYPNA